MFHTCWVAKSIRNFRKFGVESIESFWISDYFQKPRKFSDRGQKRGFRKPRKFLANLESFQLESFWTSLYLFLGQNPYPKPSFSERYERLYRPSYQVRKIEPRWHYCFFAKRQKELGNGDTETDSQHTRSQLVWMFTAITCFWTHLILCQLFCTKTSNKST